MDGVESILRATPGPAPQPAGARGGGAPAGGWLSGEHLLWLLSQLAGRDGRPFDERLAAASLPDRIVAADLPELLAAHGYPAEPVPLGDAAPPIPCIAFEQPAAAGSAGWVPLVVHRWEDGRALVQRFGTPAPAVMAATSLRAQLAPEVLPLRAFAENAPPPEPSGLDPLPERFGFRWFVPRLLAYRGLWRDVLLASLLIQGLGVAVPLMTQVVIDKVVATAAYSTLVVVAVALGLFAAFSAVLAWIRQTLILHAGSRIDAALGNEVFRRLLQLPLDWFESRPLGSIVTRLHGVETIRAFLTGAAITLVLDIPFVLLFLVLMFGYSWELSLVVLAALASIVLLSVLVTPALRRRADQQFAAGARLQSLVTEHLSGIATLKLLRAETALARRYERCFGDYVRAGFATRQLANGYGTGTGALEQAMSIGILVAGALRVMNDPGFTVGMLVAFQMLAARLSQPVLRLAGLWLEAQQAAVAVRRLRDLMEHPAEAYAGEARRDVPDARGVRFEGVSFRYGAGRPRVLQDFDLEVRAGELVVLTGASGSGKSTVARLLAGFAAPSSGRLLVNGVESCHLAADEMRTAVAVIQQDTRLFAGSVLDNLRLGCAAVSFGDVVQICRGLGIHEAIQSLPEGYGTVLGESGTGLSGGQRQRLAIARALLRRPDILVCDEATSGLDPEAAAEVADAIGRIKPAFAVVFIAHHWPRNLPVDRVVRLDGGRGREVAA